MKDWFLPALFTFFLWGAWGFIPKITTRYLSPVSAVVFEAAGALIVGVAVLFFLGFRPDIHPKGIGLAISTGIVGILGALCYLTAIKKGKVSVVVTMTALYPLFSIGLAYFFLKEPINRFQSIGIILGVAGSILVMFTH